MKQNNNTSTLTAKINDHKQLMQITLRANQNAKEIHTIKAKCGKHLAYDS